MVPTFQVSIVTGEGLDDLKHFLSKLTPKFPKTNDFSLIKTPKDKTGILLDNVINTKFGCIHSGIIVSGKIGINQKLLMGPTIDGGFKLVQVKEIYYLRIPVNDLCCDNLFS